jgi:microcystin-dependent protein
MPYNPAGLFSLVASYFASPGTSIRTEQHNPVFEDVASALSSVYLRDGRAPMTGDVNMNGFAINNVVAGNSAGSVATLAQAMPIGAVIDYALKTAPAGWALCVGQILLANTPYTTLRTLLINDAFPYGQDGSGNPKLPDARGCVTAGFDQMGGGVAGKLTGAFGGSIGLQTHTLTVAQLASHYHNAGILDIGHAHSYQTNSGTTAGPGGGGTLMQGPVVVSTSVNATGVQVTSDHGPGTTYSVGSDQPHNNVQPTIIMNKIIRVSYDV